jgi:hypothetical protein
VVLLILAIYRYAGFLEFLISAAQWKISIRGTWFVFREIISHGQLCKICVASFKTRVAEFVWRLFSFSRLGASSWPPCTRTLYYLFCHIVINYTSSGWYFFNANCSPWAYSGNLPLCRVPGIFNFCCTVKNKHPRHMVRFQRDNFTWTTLQNLRCKF